ncbi:Nn.00g079820.m01.CDS01 [Neocucurbitaria sp. VM-36]
MEAYPKPRHQYIYTPRHGQRGFLSYAGQQPNGAYPAGAMGGYGYGVGVGYAGAGVGYAAGGYYPGVYNARPHYPYPYGGNYYGGYYNYGLYGSMYPLANFYSPYQRTYYNTAPSYGYQSYVYPPDPSATTTTTTYHVTNSQGPSYSPAARVETRAACNHGSTRENIQLENRRIATERGAYDARRIKPADARSDDPFWCRERNGEWHLRTYYQIENECHPGRWMMDANQGFLVFNRE